MRSKSSIAPITVELAGVGAAAAVAPSVASTSVRTYAGVADCAKSIIAERGIAGATQGLTATIARNVVGVSAYFFVYEVRRQLRRQRRRVSAHDHRGLVYSVCAECVTWQSMWSVECINDSGSDIQ